MSSVSVNAGSSNLVDGGNVVFDFSVDNSDQRKIKDGGPNIRIDAIRVSDGAIIGATAGPASMNFPLTFWGGGAVHCQAVLYGFSHGVADIASCEFDVSA